MVRSALQLGVYFHRDLYLVRDSPSSDDIYVVVMLLDPVLNHVTPSRPVSLRSVPMLRASTVKLVANFQFNWLIGWGLVMATAVKVKCTGTSCPR